MKQKVQDLLSQNKTSSTQHNLTELLRLAPDDKSDEDESLVEDQTTTTDATVTEKKWDSSIVREEVSKMWTIAWPVTLTRIFRQGMFNTDSAFIGHLGVNKLAGTTLAMVWIQCLIMFINGPAYILNTLCSQAVGAGNPTLAGQWLQLALVIVMTFSAIAAIALQWTGQIIGLVEKNAEVVHYAAIFGRWAGLIIPSVGMYMAVRMYFQALEITKPATAISIGAVGLNVGINYFFIFTLKLGYVGSPIATATCVLIQLIAFLIYTCLYRKYHVKYWTPWSCSIFTWAHIKSYMSLALPMTIATAVEEWGFQVITMISGTFAPYETAAMTILYAMFWGVLNTVMRGVGVAIMVRVGFFMGAGDVPRAKLVLKIGVVMGLTAGTLIAIFAFCIRNVWGRLFSTDEKVIETVSQMTLYLVGMFYVAMQGWIGASALEGMGRNVIVMTVYAIGVWFVYVPLAIYTGIYADVSCRLCWIYYSGIIAEVVRVVSIWTVVFRTDWDEMSRQARLRSEVRESDGNEVMTMVDDEGIEKRDGKVEYIQLDEKRKESGVDGGT